MSEEKIKQKLLSLLRYDIAPINNNSQAQSIAMMPQGNPDHRTLPLIQYNNSGIRQTIDKQGKWVKWSDIEKLIEK